MNSEEKEAIATLNEHLDHWKRLLSEKICDQDEGEKTIDALQNAIKALEQQPCDDAISRSAVLDLPRIKTHNVFGNVIYESVDVENVRRLPSVTAQPKMGQWKRINKEKYVQHAMSYYRCSECGEEIIGKHNYCPMCGCKMQEVKDEKGNNILH